MTDYTFFSLDVMSCELDCLLNILKSQELKELQKSFNINLNSSKSKTKPEMIKSFLNLVKNQRTFCGNSMQNLKERFVVLNYINFILPHLCLFILFKVSYSSSLFPLFQNIHFTYIHAPTTYHY